MQKLLTISSIVANFAIILGIFLFFYERQIELNDLRDKNSFAQSDRFFGGDVAGSRQRLEHVLHLYEFPQAPSHGFKLEDIDRLVKKIIAVRGGTGIITSDLVVVVDHFYRVVFCVESGRCDPKLIDDLYLEYVRDFLCIFGSQAKEQYLNMNRLPIFERVEAFSRNKRCDAA